MNKTFRTAGILLFLIMLVAFSAYASDCDVEFKGSVVNVFGSAEPNTSVGFLMYKTGGEKLADTSYVFQAKADENGDFGFEFYMKDFNKKGEAEDVWSGNYTCVVSNGENHRSYTMDYLSYIERNKLIKAVNTSSDNDIFKGSNNQNIKRLEVMGAETDAFSNASNEIKVKVAKLLKDGKPYTEYDEESLLKAFFDAYVVTTLNECKTGTEVAGFIKNNTGNGIVIREETLNNSALLGYTGEYIFKKLPYSSVDDINKDINKAGILYKIVNSDKKTMITHITANASEIGVSGTAYFNKYISSEAVSIAVNENIILSLVKNPAVDIEQFAELFKTMAEAYQPVFIPGNTGSSGGGGGGGAGSAGGRNFFSETAVTPTVANTMFKDVNENMWSYIYIKDLAEKGIINGFSDGNFCPDNSVTREQFLKMLLLALNIPAQPGECSFSDVSGSEWYYGYVCSAVKNNIVSGISSDKFGTGENITRQDASSIIYRALNNMGITLNTDNSEDKFADDGEISNYAYSAVYEMKRAGIISGHDNGCFEPNGTLTRAQAAKMIYGIINRG